MALVTGNHQDFWSLPPCQATQYWLGIVTTVLNVVTNSDMLESVLTHNDTVPTSHSHCAPIHLYSSSSACRLVHPSGGEGRWDLDAILDKFRLTKCVIKSTFFPEKDKSRSRDNLLFPRVREVCAAQITPLSSRPAQMDCLLWLFGQTDHRHQTDNPGLYYFRAGHPSDAAITN